MSCCGKRRQQFYSEQSGPIRSYFYIAPGNQDGPKGQPLSGKQTVICLEYTGNTVLNVIGTVSGKRYRFEGHGSKVIIDPRDRTSLILVPNLKQVFI